MDIERERRRVSYHPAPNGRHDVTITNRQHNHGGGEADAPPPSFTKPLINQDVLSVTTR